MIARALHFYRQLSSQPWWRVSSRWLGRGVQLGVTLAVLTYVWTRLRAEDPAVWGQLLALDLWGYVCLLAALLLMPLNLGFEARKWWVLLRPLYPELKPGAVWQGVFAGLATGIFTPNRVGEYAGRILYLPPGRRTAALVYLFMDRIGQMVVTLWMGTLAMEGLWATRAAWEHSLWLEVAGGARLLLWASSLLAPGLLLQHRRVAAWLHRHFDLAGKTHHLALGVAALGRLERRVLWQVLGLGIARYLTFALQYLFLLYACGYSGGWPLALAMIGGVFLVKSLIPSLALSELGVRESVALAIMGLYGLAAFTAFASTFLLYLCNLILPALIGLLFMHRLRMGQEDHESPARR
jgi:uncharacterized membrane protein YbhN (UPF0104 family)